MDRLDEEHHPRCAQYVAWRRSLLHFGALFYTFIVVLQLWLFILDITGENPSVLLNQIHERYHQYFDRMLLYQYLMSIAFLGSSVFAVVFAAMAAFSWNWPVRSRRMVQLSFIFSYVPPFVVLLFMPVRHSVDFIGIQQQFCRDLMGRPDANADWNATQLNNTGPTDLWPGRAGELAQLLLTSYGIRLRDDFCDQEPTTWPPLVMQALDDRGVLLRKDGTCPALDYNLATMQVAATVVTAQAAPATGIPTGDHCSGHCANCSTVCAPHLARHGMALALYGTDVLDSMNLVGISSRCKHCFSMQNSLQCLQCREVRDALTRAAYVSQKTFDGPGCLAPEDLKDFELLATLAAQTAYWKALLGFAYAMYSFAQVAPYSFALLLGASKGSSIAKSVIPHSRIPEIIGSSAAVFTFPFIVMLAIVFQSISGNTLTLLGMLSLLTALILKMKPSRMAALNHEALQKQSHRMGQACMFAIFLAASFFMAALFTSDLATAVYDLFKFRGYAMSESTKSAIQRNVALIGVQTVCNFFGKSLISTVFFADSVVGIMVKFHYSEAKDAVKVQIARAQLVMDLRAFFQAQELEEDICREEEGTPTIKVAQIAPCNDDGIQAEMIEDSGTAEAACKPDEVPVKPCGLQSTIQIQDAKEGSQNAMLRSLANLQLLLQRQDEQSASSAFVSLVRKAAAPSRGTASASGHQEAGQTQTEAQAKENQVINACVQRLVFESVEKQHAGK
eukprot:TRINITY_DN35323_c0_g1_i1.p1 TRINITY_DN35323_c0_g1~~TRINITY_DN35323_c0_g1_i1.p1  ORF type:complete len:732 (+),score=123.87 TRINITY_DN35323_c0_g1_i1:367-2562(+)